MSEMKKVFKWWWPWQSDKIESMLESMAADGWVLVSAGSMLTDFTFEKAEPANVRYCIDYQEKAKTEYFTLLEDAGWKMVHKGSGWYVWSMAYESERPELYTDVDFMIRQSTSILAALTAIFVAQIPLLTVAMYRLHDASPLILGLFAIWGVAVGLMTAGAIITALGIRKLKRRKGAAANKKG